MIIKVMKVTYIPLVVAGRPDYECLFVDVETNGRNPDGHSWTTRSLEKAIENPDDL